VFKFASKCICSNCGTQGSGRLRGSAFITFLLLCCGIVPGLMYSAWRGAGPRHCKRCRQAALVPLDSPKGRALAA
jgi:hypothetical protein